MKENTELWFDIKCYLFTRITCSTNDQQSLPLTALNCYGIIGNSWRQCTWIDPSYSPGGTNVHSLAPHESASSIWYLDRSSRFAKLTVVTNTQTAPHSACTSRLHPCHVCDADWQLRHNSHRFHECLLTIRWSITATKNRLQKLCYCRRTDRAKRYISRNLAKCCITHCIGTNCTNPQQTEVMELELYGRLTGCNKLCASSHHALDRRRCHPQAWPSTSFVENTNDSSSSSSYICLFKSWQTQLVQIIQVYK